MVHYQRFDGSVSCPVNVRCPVFVSKDRARLCLIFCEFLIASDVSHRVPSLYLKVCTCHDISGRLDKFLSLCDSWIMCFCILDFGCGCEWGRCAQNVFWEEYGVVLNIGVCVYENDFI